MAIAGGANSSFDLQVVDGKVHRGTYGLRQGVETNMDRAVEKLLAGEVVFCHAYEDKVKQVRLRVEAELEKQGCGENAVSAPETVTIAKADYDATQQQIADLQARIDELEVELAHYEGEL